MAFAEFPNAKYFCDDESEVMALYEKMLNSYNAMLRRLSNTEADIQNIYLKISEQVNKNITPYILQVNNKIDALKAELNEDIAKANQRIDILTSLLDTDVTMLNSKLEYYHSEFIQMQHLYNAKLVTLENEINDNIRSVQIELEEEIQKLWNQIKNLPTNVGVVNNPVSRTLTSADIALNDIFLFLMPDIAIYLDCKNMENYNTYQSIADKDYTYRNAVMWGKTLLGLWEEYTHMISPVSGKWEKTNQAIDDVYGQISKLSITATEYDSLNISATDYDNKKLSATDYDVKARSEL